MDITQLHNDVTRKLETEVTKLSNIKYMNMDESSCNRASNREMFLYTWYRCHGLRPGYDTRKKYEETMANILGCNFNYRRQYEYRTAVWGFVWNKYNLEFVIWLSERGLEIGVQKKMNEKMFFDFCEEFAKLILTEEGIKETERFLGHTL